MTTDDLSFPVIAFAKDGSVLSYPNKAALTEFPKQALKNGYFVGLIIVDSKGQMTNVESVQRVHKSYSFAQSISGFFSGSIQVDLMFGTEGHNYIGNVMRIRQTRHSRQ